LPSHFVKRRARVLQDVKLVEDHFGPRQHLADDIHVRPVHVGADGLDCGALPGLETLIQQRAQTVFAPILRQPDHFAADQVAQHGPEMLAFSPLDFIDAEMLRSVCRARASPRLQERSLRSARRAQLTTCRAAA
jgi:hypothetical protein